MMSEMIDESKMPQMMSRIVTVCHTVFTVSHNVHKFTLDVTYVQKGIQLVTKICYYLEFSYIYNHSVINSLCGYIFVTSSNG